MGQPPSGIGPGALGPYNPYGLNNGYTMAYGEDRDPYGAQMPYNIGYQTYNPNYPSIPGVTNSFAPSTYSGGTPYDQYGAQISNGMVAHQPRAPVQMAAGGTPRAIVSTDYSQDLTGHGHTERDDNESIRARNASQQYGQMFGQAYGEGPQTTVSPSLDSEQPLFQGTSFIPAATPARRQITMPQPIGTRRPSQVDELSTGHNRARTMSGGPNGPQFASPFRNGPQQEIRLLGHTEENGDVYQVVDPNTSANANGNSTGIDGADGNSTYNALHHTIASGNGGGRGRGRIAGSDTYQDSSYNLPGQSPIRLQ